MQAQQNIKFDLDFSFVERDIFLVPEKKNKTMRNGSSFNFGNVSCKG